MEKNASVDADRRFSQLAEGLVTKAQIETKCENADILRDVIRAHIYTWLDQVEAINSLYKVSELIPVGSYAEGTKIIQPDEFDYLAVIEELSKPDVITIVADERNIQRGLVKVVVDDENLKSKCRGLCKDGHLKCFQPVNFPAVTEKRFGHILMETLWTFVRCSKRKGPTTGSPTDIKCNVLLPAVNNMSLNFKGAYFRAPNVLIEFEYKSCEVTVDVSPAIRYHKIQDCFRENECAGPAFAELVLSRQSLLLVGTDFGSDFKVTVTEAEVEYIQRVMKPEHKLIYIFLKYIVKLYKERAHLLCTFSSYMMKTVCIHHDIKCKKNERIIKDCFKTILDDLNSCAQQSFVISIVNRHIHIEQGAEIEREQKCDRESLLQGLRTMCQVPTDIETVTAYDTFLKQIVHNEWQKRSKANEEKEKLDNEYAESFRAELKERVSQIVDMGFEYGEVKKVMENTLYDSELAVKILLKHRAKALEEQKFKVPVSCSASNKDAMPNCQTVSGSEQCPSRSASEGTSNAATSFRDKDTNSRQILPALTTAKEDVKYEILYQRQKDV